MMPEVHRPPFVFSSEKAAQFYDIVLSHGYDGDLTDLAWTAAHKFGATVTSSECVSFRHGLIRGKRAEEAAAFFNEQWKRAFAECPEYGRRAAMARVSHELVRQTEEQYGVTIEVNDPYYY